jgi:hypothetical protein
MAKDLPPTAHEAFGKIRDALADILARHDDCSTAAATILVHLGFLEGTLREATGERQHNGVRAEAEAPQRGGRNQPKHYAVRKIQDEEMLMEYRLGSDIPFSSPKRVFDAVAQVLAKAERPFAFDDIQRRLAEKLGEAPPDYQVRVCLRFFTSPGVLFAKRNRARYLVNKKGGSIGRSQSLWKTLKKDQPPSQRAQ